MPLTHPSITLADLPNRKVSQFVYEPDAAALSALSAEFNLQSLRKMRLQGTLSPKGRSDWQLEAVLGATILQECVVTLDPVQTRIDERVSRFYTNDLPELDTSEEVETPEDDTVESKPAVLHLDALATEVLALSIPQYPRAEGATVDTVNFTEPGKTAMTDEDTRPFAGLAGLRDQLSDKKSD